VIVGGAHGGGVNGKRRFYHLAGTDARRSASQQIVAPALARLCKVFDTMTKATSTKPA